MRKFFLISAMVLASATAQAGQSRNLSPVAANDEQPVVTTSTTTAQPPRAAEADTSRIPAEPVYTVPTSPAPPVATSPQYEERPPAVAPAATTTAPPLANPPTTTTTTTTTTTVAPPAKADAPRRTAKAGRRGRGGYWTEARIIGELHRYGIYW